jgi:hypothetical protein
MDTKDLTHVGATVPIGAKSSAMTPLVPECQPLYIGLAPWHLTELPVDFDRSAKPTILIDTREQTPRKGKYD